MDYMKADVMVRSVFFNSYEPISLVMTNNTEVKMSQTYGKEAHLYMSNAVALVHKVVHHAIINKRAIIARADSEILIKVIRRMADSGMRIPHVILVADNSIISPRAGAILAQILKDERNLFTVVDVHQASVDGTPIAVSRQGMTMQTYLKYILATTTLILESSKKTIIISQESTEEIPVLMTLMNRAVNKVPNITYVIKEGPTVVETRAADILEPVVSKLSRVDRDELETYNFKAQGNILRNALYGEATTKHILYEPISDDMVNYSISNQSEEEKEEEEREDAIMMHEQLIQSLYESAYNGIVRGF